MHFQTIKVRQLLDTEAADEPSRACSKTRGQNIVVVMNHNHSLDSIIIQVEQQKQPARMTLEEACTF